jgi:hypothetical protein
MNESFRKAEIKLFVLLIPVINLFNYYLTYTDIRFTTRTLITFAIDTAQGYVAWFAIHMIIIRLDKAMPYEKNVLKRILSQILLTLFAGISVIIILTTLIHFLFKAGQPFPVSFFSNDILIISVWFLVLNGVYISMDFFREWQSSQRKLTEENKLRSGGLRVKTGKQDLQLAFDTIGGFVVDGEYILCYTSEGKKFLIDMSMDKLEKLVPANTFFRLNRQFLLHRQAILGFEKAENGKLKILTKSISFSAPITVSRTRAPEFKRWFSSH